MATKFKVQGRPQHIVGRLIVDGDEDREQEIRAIVWCLGPVTAYLQWRNHFGGDGPECRYTIWQIDQDGRALNTLYIQDFRWGG